MLEIKACQQAIRQFLRRRGSEPLLSKHNGGTLASRMPAAGREEADEEEEERQARTATVVVTIFLCFSTDGIPRKRQQGRKACGQYESKEVTVLVLKVLQFSTVTCKLKLELLLEQSEA